MPIVRRRLPLVLVVSSLVLFGTVVAIGLAPKLFSSTTTINVPVPAGASANVGRDDLDYADRQLNTYKRLAEGDSLRRAVERELGSDVDGLVLTLIPNTELADLSARAGDAQVSRRAADLAATTLIRRLRARATADQRAARTRLEAEIEALADQIATRLVQVARTNSISRRTKLREEVRVRRLRIDALAEQSTTLENPGEPEALSPSLSRPTSGEPGHSARA